MSYRVTLLGASGAAEVTAVLAEHRLLALRPVELRLFGQLLEVTVSGRRQAELLAERLARREIGAIIEACAVAAVPLTGRERQLVELLARGLVMKEVARRMGVSVYTAREYWSRVKVKWGVRSVGEATVMWALQSAESRPAQAG